MSALSTSKRSGWYETKQQREPPLHTTGPHQGSSRSKRAVLRGAGQPAPEVPLKQGQPDQTPLKTRTAHEIESEGKEHQKKEKEAKEKETEEEETKENETNHGI